MTNSPGGARASAKSSRFVGRAAVLGELSDLLARSGERNTAAYIVGETGIGKTRLVEELTQAAEQAGFSVVWGRPQQYAEDFPFLAFLQIVNRIRGFAGNSGGILIESASPTEWAHLSVDARALRTKFVLNIAQAIAQHAAVRKTVIVVDDIQWADVASLLLMSTLLDMAGSGLALVCMRRSDGVQRPELHGLTKAIEARSRIYELDGLDVAEVSELAGDLVGAATLTEREVEALQTWTRGNPLFVHEMLVQLRDDGLLEKHGLEEALNRSRLPARLSEIVSVRVKSLGQPIRRLLSAAAVLGDEIDTASMASVLGEGESGVADLLDSACHDEVLVAADDVRGARFRFRHPTHRKALYDLLQPSERRALHQRLSELSEAGVLHLSVQERARHSALGQSSTGEAAAKHCTEAALQAEALLAYESAARFWEMALDCTPPPDVARRADLLRRQGWALWAASSWRRGAEAWMRAIDLYESLGELREVANLALALGDMLRWRQELQESEAWLERALAGLTKDDPGHGRALALLGSIQSLRGASEQGLHTLQEAVAATERVGASDPRVDFWLSYGLRRAGDPEGGRAVAERGLSQAVRDDNAHEAIVLAGTLARMELSELRLQASQGYIESVESLSDQADTAALIMLLQARVYIHGYQGEWLRVAQLCESTMASLRMSGGYQIASAQAFWAEAQFALGRPEAALSTLRQALPNVEEMQDVCRVHIARILASIGRGAECVDDARRYLDLSRQSAGPRSGTAVLGDAVASMDEPSLWAPAYDLLVEEPFPLMFVYSPVSVSRVLGRLTTRLRRWSETAGHFEEAIEQLSTGGAKWELMKTYLDYAAMRRARGRRGDAVKADALELKAQELAAASGFPAFLERQSPKLRPEGNAFGLSGREVEVLSLVANGLRNREIADALSLSPHTVERHLENIYGKMGVRGRAEAVVGAVQAGLVGTPAAGESSGA